MGAKESKQLPLSSEEALKRVTESEKRRLQDAFRRLSSRSTSNGSSWIAKNQFVSEVLGEIVPGHLGDRIYTLALQASGSSSHGKGLYFRDILTILVLITRGTREEKIKMMFGLLTSSNSGCIEKADMFRLVRDWEKDCLPHELQQLFQESDKVPFEVFSSWIEAHPDSLGISRWLLSPTEQFSLVNKLDTPTFYQTLAGVTHLDEEEIVELEKRFWTLCGSSPSAVIDLSLIKNLLCPPLPHDLAGPFFHALDENEDGHIDLKELSCGVSAACRGPELERQKFVFKMFDLDRDGVLNPAEFDAMIYLINEVFLQVNKGDGSAFLSKSTGKGTSLTLQEFLVWTSSQESGQLKEFSRLLYQLCHVCLGLKPLTRNDEGDIVRGWIEREEKMPHSSGAIWNLVSMNWWSNWHAYVNFHPNSTPKMVIKSKKHNAVASNTAQGIIATGYSPILDSNHRHSGSTSSLSSLTSKKSLDESGGSASGSSNTSSLPRPGHIDNTHLTTPSPYRVNSLTGEGARLKPKIHQGKDFELVPDRLWKALILWYGDALALPRQTILNSRGVYEVELYPIAVKIMKHQVVPRPPQIPTVVGGYSAAAITAAAGNLPTTTRRYIAHQAVFSRRTTINQISDFLSSRLGNKPEDMRLWFYRDDHNMKQLAENEGRTLEDLTFRDDDGILVEVRSRDGTWPEEISSLMSGGNKQNNHNVNVSGIKGVTGLNNLGNTCYMNASIQCVAHTEILSKYFSNNCHLFELNRTNPLGMKGHIAKRFGDLVRDMWSGEARTIAPIKLRWTIGRYRQHFSGFQQQDSQELLAFLLDGLHEDLNRVTEKPYMELKDSAGRPDDEVAAEAWESHSGRNKSIIVDLFHGQLKSKVTCKVCGHESVRFDPFTYLSLPLPMESSVHIEVILIRQDGSIPSKYGLTLDMDSKYTVIRLHLNKLCRIPAQNLILVDVVNAQFRVPPSEEQKVKNMNGSCIFAYEFKARRSPMSASGTQTFSDIQRSSSCKKTNGQDVIKNGPIGGKEDKSTKMEASHTNSVNNNNNKSESPPEMNGGSSLPSASTFFANLPKDLGDCQRGIIVALNRKMIPQESYFLSTQKYQPVLFGLPLIINCDEKTSYQDLYKSVWTQVSRLVSPLPPRETITQNHALDCDDSLKYEYPFVLKVVQKGGSWCHWCPWHRFCRGCAIPCSSKEYAFSSSFIAIDWDQTALHLRYRSSQEKVYDEDPSVQESIKRATEPITLGKCLQAFTREEQLGPDEKYYCSICKTHQLAAKKLQIWKLPPILIVHLKRFHYLNGRWIKSHKIVEFPSQSFEPSDYLAAVPSMTLKRYKHLKVGPPHQNSSPELLNGGDSVLEEDDEVFEEDALPSGSSFASSSSAQQQYARTRQESTSLNILPVIDDNLRDFHQHRLKEGSEPLDIQYNMYGLVCHSGVLGGGHYTSYTKHFHKWYLNNDSTCKEVQESQIDKSSAYMLFYERDSLSSDSYLPKISGPLPSTQDLDDELDIDFKKQCSLM